ncbi:MAG: DUF2147 domain-containing protein [Alphaproteobacteria bacterium]|jgi:uncharacterized protein (DUF2147 family)|nr:DUF2147 domain-containing protein [Alphaproteobacteria bacterium]MDP6564343.1 DUF2147 domain-containing protein [Alphaproteobacteria bacterium]MDP6815145.1 DUF2147 domain-containing protein [Alphaproteobacteria bacterium]
MSKMIAHVAAAAMLAAWSLAAGGAAAADAVGVWATEGGKSHVQIMPCEDKLCGTIIWLKEPLNDEGEPKHDANNPEEEMQARPILGLPLLTGFVPNGEAGVWDDGEIYNPEDGETYSCTLTLVDDDTLKVRGYVGLPLFGKTQIWTRVN